MTKVTTTNDLTDTDADGNGEADHNGQAINYTIEVDNTGNTSLTDVVVTDLFADCCARRLLHTLYVGDWSSDVCSYDLQYTATHTVTQAEIDAGTSLVNTAEVTDHQGD